MKHYLVLFLWMLFVAGCTVRVNGQIVTTTGGNGFTGYNSDGIAATTALLNTPTAIARDGAGNVYFSDQLNYRVRKIDAITGVISTVAGNGAAGSSGDGGPATDAKINQCWGIAVDPAGNIYIADENNHRVRLVNTSGIINNFAGTGYDSSGGDGGLAVIAYIKKPFGITVDGAGNVYVGDLGNQTIRKINTAGIISTVAGIGLPGYTGDGGPATNARLSDVWGLAASNSGNLYICDGGSFSGGGNNAIRKIDAAGIITTVAGTGTSGYNGDNIQATDARLSQPTGVFADKAGNLIIADCMNNRVRKVNPSGIISTIGGTGVADFNGDGLAATATKFNQPLSIIADDSGTIYFVDLVNERIRTIHKVLRFYNGYAQHFDVCVNLSTPIDSALAVVDQTIGKTIKWDTIRGPFHGHIATFPYYRVSTGDYILPAGLSYTPDGTAGFDTITVTVSDGVDTSQTILYLDINPLLTYAGVINGPSGVCVGSSITLTETIGNGVWSMSNLNAINSGGVVFGESQGTDSVIYTLSDACGRVSATKLITIYPQPDAGQITGNASLCIGSSGTLTDSVPGGTWSKSNDYVSINTAGIITGVSAGTDTILYLVSDVNCSNKATYTVTVDPFPSAQITDGDSVICLGSGTTLSGVPGGGIWRFTNSLLSFSGSVITGVATGMDTINYIYSNHCGIDTATTNVIIEPLPTIPSIVQNAYTLSVPAGYYSYQWLFNGAPMPGATRDSLEFTLAGLYTATVQNEFGCEVSSPTIECGGCTVNDIQIYPNPTQSVVYISWCKRLTVKLLCIDGKEVAIDTDIDHIDLRILPDAVYLLVIYDENGHKIKTKKIVKTPE